MTDTPTRTCTGLTAKWCPVHGDCRCEPIPGVRGPGEPGDDPQCPLHAPTSTHASRPTPDDLLAEVAVRTEPGNGNWTGRFELAMSDPELARRLAAEVERLQAALREIADDDVYVPTLGGLGQFRANTLATVKRALADVARPTPDPAPTGDQPCPNGACSHDAVFHFATDHDPTPTCRINNCTCPTGDVS